MKTPNYVLTEEFSYTDQGGNSNALPAGSFIRPVATKWVPKHVQDSRWLAVHEEGETVYCYCKCGFLVIPWKLIREVT